MKIKSYQKQIIAFAVFFICMIAVWLYPLKAVNVTLQMDLTNAADGLTAELVVEREDGESSVTEASVYSGKITYRFNPDDYQFQTIGLRIIGAEEQPGLENLRAYSGTCDLSKDPVIFESPIGAEAQPAEDNSYSFVLDDETVQGLYGAIHQNLSVRWVLTAGLCIVFALVLLFLSKHRQKDWNKFLRYALLVFCGLVLVYVLFNSDFKRESTLQYLPTVTHEAATEPQEDVAKQQVDKIEIAGEDSIRQTFMAGSGEMQRVRIYFETTAEQAETADMDVGIRLISPTGETVASQVFSAKRLQTTGMAELKFPAFSSQQGKLYTLEIKPLNQNGFLNLQLQIEKGIFDAGEVLTVSEEPLADYGIRCDVGYTSNKYLPAFRILVLAGVLILLVFVAVYRKLHIKPKTAVLLIYGAIFLYAAGQILFYIKYAGNTPDEPMHIAYIAYLTQTKAWIPNFAEMQQISSIHAGTFSFVDGTVNYLGHPPLYYHLMRLCNPVEMVGENTFVLHLVRLRLFSASFGLLALGIAFYIGYTRITKDQPALHLLYGSAIIGVPMFLYNLSGVNNDTLSLLGCVVFFLGLLRICEEKKNYGTYLLIAAGLVVTLLSKVTAGALLGIAAVIFVIWYCIKNKSIQIIVCRQFAVSLLVYGIGIAYFAFLYMNYHVLQPDYNTINPELYRSSSLFTAFESRSSMSLFEYFLYYWKNFFDSWTGIASHVSLYKQGTWLTADRIFTLLILFVPILLFFVSKRRKYVPMLISLYVAFAAVALLQFQRAFETYFYIAGYLGGFQSRYYLCILPILAFIAVYLLQMVNDRKIPQTAKVNSHEGMIQLSPQKLTIVVSIVASSVLLYSSFVYFLFNYFR